jgi:hypothetical protein
VAVIGEYSHFSSKALPHSRSPRQLDEGGGKRKHNAKSYRCKDRMKTHLEAVIAEICLWGIHLSQVAFIYLFIYLFIHSFVF